MSPSERQGRTAQRLARQLAMWRWIDDHGWPSRPTLTRWAGDRRLPRVYVPHARRHRHALVATMVLDVWQGRPPCLCAGTVWAEWIALGLPVEGP